MKSKPIKGIVRCYWRAFKNENGDIDCEYIEQSIHSYGADCKEKDGKLVACNKDLDYIFSEELMNHDWEYEVLIPLITPEKPDDWESIYYTVADVEIEYTLFDTPECKEWGSEISHNILHHEFITSNTEIIEKLFKEGLEFEAREFCY